MGDDDGDLPPEARAVFLEGIDIPKLMRESGQSPAMHRHEQIAAVLRQRRDGEISAHTAREALHRIDPDHYESPRD